MSGRGTVTGTEQPPAVGRIHPTVLLMASAHFMVDGYGNIYAPLLPLLIPKLHLSLAAAGTLTMFYQMAASVAQVGFGHIADRWRPRLLVMLGPVVAVGVLSFVGVAPSVPTLAGILVVGGLGAAAFHPPAAAIAHRLGGARPGLAMSVHITGGTLGFSLGPLLFAPAAQHLGLGWTPLLAIPGLIVVAFFLTRVPPIPLHHDSAAGFRALRPYARPLALLYAIVVLRTLASLAFATFVPVMLTRRGLSVSTAGAIAAVYLFASGAGGFLGGPAADRFGPRNVIAWSLVLATPFLLAAPLLSGWRFVVVLAIGGFFLQSTLPVNVIFGQALAPVSAATVSSLMMGFAWGMGGFSVPIVGAIADRYGIERTLFGLAAVPLLAAALTAWLPKRPAA
ncbi:MAG TPA: MFS transporter [Vicinamibacterales bacterium]|jgi:FSR family fosmidomycin resistance protein-like MFS transporter|nr:MFS transporter [Vicinamibacterales bacterium]